MAYVLRKNIYRKRIEGRRKDRDRDWNGHASLRRRNKVGEGKSGEGKSWCTKRREDRLTIVNDNETFPPDSLQLPTPFWNSVAIVPFVLRMVYRL